MEQTQIQMRTLWDEAIRTPAIEYKYGGVFVLILSWEPSLDDLNTSLEVRKLTHLSTYKYGFHVEQTLLSCISPQQHLDCSLANFVAGYDGDDSLLIVYYAGHAYADDESGLRLFSGRTPHSHHVNGLQDVQISWQPAEGLLSSSDGDILAIFDCCHAGVLTSPYSQSPAPTFEYLAACGVSERTPAPGRSSFTASLILALEDLAVQGSFDTTELATAISGSPHFPATQDIALSSNSSSPIVLQPILTQSSAGSISRFIESVHRRFDEFHLYLGSLSVDYGFMPGHHERPLFRGLELDPGGIHRRRPRNNATEREVNRLPTNTSDIRPSSPNAIGTSCSRAWSRSFSRVCRNSICFFGGQAEISRFFSKAKPKIWLESIADLAKDRSTVLVTTSCCLILCMAFTMRAYFEPSQSGCTTGLALDNNFYSTLASLATSICSVYLTVVPLIRSHSLSGKYTMWYRASLVFSLLSAIMSVITYPYSWRLSLISGSVASMLQVIASLQLVECFQNAVDTGDIGSVELRLLT